MRQSLFVTDVENIPRPHLILILPEKEINQELTWYSLKEILCEAYLLDTSEELLDQIKKWVIKHRDRKLIHHCFCRYCQRKHFQELSNQFRKEEV